MRYQRFCVYDFGMQAKTSFMLQSFDGNVAIYLGFDVLGVVDDSSRLRRV